MGNEGMLSPSLDAIIGLRNESYHLFDVQLPFVAILDSDVQLRYSSLAVARTRRGSVLKGCFGALVPLYCVSER